MSEAPRKPNFEKLDKRAKAQGEVRDAHQKNREVAADNWEVASDLEQRKVQTDSVLSKVGLTVGIGLIRQFARLSEWNMPRLGNWADEYGKELGEAMEWHWKRIHDSTEALTSYITQKYGVDIMDHDRPALPENVEHDPRVQELVLTLANVSKEYTDFEAKHGSVPIKNPITEVAKGFAQLLVETFPHLRVHDFTDNEAKYAGMRSDLNTLIAYRNLMGNSSRNVEGEKPGVDELNVRIEKMQKELEEFIEKHPGVREKTEYKIHVRRAPDTSK